MRWLINYIRQCFCVHDWERLDTTDVWGTDTKYPEKRIYTYRCKKCGVSKTYVIKP